jgi:pimeloyl-ACP methyl ester carboxylesterase
MSDYILVPGDGGEAWYWHRVTPLLRAAGHDVVAVGLPAADDAAGLDDYADAILAAIGDRRDVVLVAQSMGAFSAPLAAVRAQRGVVTGLLLVAPMIPTPGESVDDWWSATGSGAAWQASEREAGRDPEAPFDPVTVFFHDVPDAVQEAAWARGEPRQGERACAEPWPLDAWPDIPTRVVVGRQDRLFPYDFARALARDRLGAEPDVIDSGHLPALARPDELAAWLRAAA